MSAGRERPYLHLVKAPDEGATTLRKAQQQELFVSPSACTLVAFDMSAASAEAFRRTIVSAKPRWAFDMRLLPAFDIDGLSRKNALRFLTEHGTTYIDIPGRARIVSVDDERLAPSHAFELIATIFKSGLGDLSGPVLVLADAAERAADYASALASSLPVPSTTQANSANRKKSRSSQKKSRSSHWNVVLLPSPRSIRPSQ